MDPPSLYALLICGVLIVGFFLVGCIIHYRKEQKKEYEIQLRKESLKKSQSQEEDGQQDDTISNHSADTDVGYGEMRTESVQIENEAGRKSSPSAARRSKKLDEEDDDDDRKSDSSIDDYLDQFENSSPNPNKDVGSAGGEGQSQLQEQASQAAAAFSYLDNYMSDDGSKSGSVDASSVGREYTQAPREGALAVVGDAAVVGAGTSDTPVVIQGEEEFREVAMTSL